jgi:hypothetical protein
MGPALPQADTRDVRPQRRFDVAAFRSMSPGERKAKLEASRAPQQKLKREIHERVEQLERKWANSRLTTRTRSLRDLQGKCPQLTAEQAQHLEPPLKAAEAAEQRVNMLVGKAKSFGPDDKKDSARVAAKTAAGPRAPGRGGAAIARVVTPWNGLMAGGCRCTSRPRMRGAMACLRGLEGWQRSDSRRQRSTPTTCPSPRTATASGTSVTP